VTRAEACEHIATLMNDWFKADVKERSYTADGIARQLDEVQDDETRVDDSVM